MFFWVFGKKNEKKRRFTFYFYFENKKNLRFLIFKQALLIRIRIGCFKVTTASALHPLQRASVVFTVLIAPHLLHVRDRSTCNFWYAFFF